MRSALTAITDELRRLKAGGQGLVSVSEESLDRLRAVVGVRLDAPAPRARPAAAGAGPAPVIAPVDTARPASVARFAPVAEPLPAPVVPVAAALPPPPAAVDLPAGPKAVRWAALRDLVLADPVCRAHVPPGKQVVLGVGSLEASLFFCGEAPGADEETVGEPFVGPAGQLLDRMIQAMGLRREDVYIGNIMNWRPELPVGPGGVQVGNRPPTAEEMGYCLPYLRAQLEIVQPKLIVALGATASAGLLGAGRFKTLGEIRGRWHDFGGVPVMVTYHPSYILRNNSNRSKRAIWEDLLQVMERAGLPVSEKQRGYFR